MHPADDGVGVGGKVIGLVVRVGAFEFFLGQLIQDIQQLGVGCVRGLLDFERR